MRLIDDQHAAGRPGQIDQCRQRRHAAIGAVERIDRDHAASVARHLPLQMLEVVVAERDRHGAGRLHALPQRGVGLHVEIHRQAGLGQRLHQPHVGSPARLRQNRILGAHKARELVFEPVLGAALLQVHRRHQLFAFTTLQGVDLGPHQRRLAGQAQVIVTGQKYRARLKRLPGMRVLAAEQLFNPRHVMRIHAPAHVIRHQVLGSKQRRVERSILASVNVGHDIFLF